MRTDPEESLGYDNREPSIPKPTTEECAALWERGWNATRLWELANKLEQERNVWKHEAEIVRKQLESEHENAIDWFISCQELKTAIWDTLKMCEDRVPSMWSLNPLKLAYAKAKSAETSLDSENVKSDGTAGDGTKNL